MARNMETLYMRKMTFSGRRQLQLQHLEANQEDKPHDQNPAPDPTTSSHRRFK